MGAVPSVLFTLAALGSLPVQAAGSVTATSSSGAAPSQRIELGLALVVLGFLIFAVTVVRVRIQARQRQAPKQAGSRWAKVTDTWEPYSPKPRPAVRRANAHSTW